VCHGLGHIVAEWRQRLFFRHSPSALTAQSVMSCGYDTDSRSELERREADGGMMESSYSIQPVDNLVRLQVWGELTVDGFTDLIRRVGRDPHYRAGMDAVCDLRQSTGNWDYSEIQRFRDYIVHIAGQRRCRWAALVKPGDLAAVGHVVIVISEEVSENIRMQMFEDPQMALRWVLGEIE